MSLITKLDFTSDRVPFTQNLDNRLIEPYINKTEKQDFKPVVPAAFYTAITGSPGTELNAFLEDFVKDFLVYATMTRFLANHGSFITQQGLREFIDATSQPVSDTARGYSIKEAEKDKNISWSALMSQAASVNYTWDGVKYNFGSNCSNPQEKNFGIRAVGVRTNFDGPANNYSDMYK